MITIGVLHIPDFIILHRVILAIIFNLSFILGVIIFVVLQFKQRRDEDHAAYYNIQAYAANLELEFNKLLVESQKQNEDLQWFVNYATTLNNQNTELEEKLTKANNTIPTNLNILNPNNNSFLNGLRGQGSIGRL